LPATFLAKICGYVNLGNLLGRFAAIQIWIFILFLIYTTVEELNARLGDGELMKIFFTKRPSEMKFGVRRSEFRPTRPPADSRRSSGSTG
jgi:hypothetical protein